MSKFNTLIDSLIDCEFRMSHYNEETQEILMTDLTIEDISILMKKVHGILKEEFSFRIVHFHENWYNVYIYNKQDISDNLIREQQIWKQLTQSITNIKLP